MSVSFHVAVLCWDYRSVIIKCIKKKLQMSRQAEFAVTWREICRKRDETDARAVTLH